MRKFIECHWTQPLWCKTVMWTPTVRIFCDGGCPIFRWVPRIRRIHYDKCWGMHGFTIIMFGREIWFSFGGDVNGLYTKH